MTKKDIVHGNAVAGSNSNVVKLTAITPVEYACHENQEEKIFQILLNKYLFEMSHFLTIYIVRISLMHICLCILDVRG